MSELPRVDRQASVDISHKAVEELAHWHRSERRNGTAHVLRELRAALTAAAEQEPWRTVESGMPPLDQWVQIYCGNMPRAKDRRQYVACRKEYGHKRRAWMTDSDDEWGVANNTVTHWRPLGANP